MSAPDEWQENNGAYLAAALDWVRALLEQRAERIRQAALVTSARASAPASAASEIQPEVLMEEPARSAPPRKRFRGWGAAREEAAPAGAPLPRETPLLPPAPSATSAAEAVASAAEEMARLAGLEPAPGLVILSRRLGLSSFEREVLLLCASMELDTRISSLCALAQAERGSPYPTFALAMSLFDAPIWEALSPDRPLRYYRLIEVQQGEGRPLTVSPLRVDERVVSFIKGLNHLDERISALVTPLSAPPEDGLSASQKALVRELVAQLTSPHSVALPVLRLRGNDARGRRQVAAAACAELGLDLLRLPVDELPSSAAELELWTRLWRREAQLMPLALYLDASGADAAQEADALVQQVARFSGRIRGLLFLDGRDAFAAALERVVSVDVRTPAPNEQAERWRHELGEASAGAAARLAGQFNLNFSEIRSIVQQTPGEPEAERAERLWRACRERTRPALDSLAKKIDAKATWDDLVLPKAELDLLRHMATQVETRSRVYDEWGFRARMNRGLGISALFAGDSGTGKTMAAEVLANALQLDLYRIDLSAVVSKYIGETEKNLRRVFDAAECGGALLFFDEADALFGKRSEVKDSHDRYANIEINYLLQRMEAFEGLAILASNLKGALDGAFMRRLRFVLTFTHPGPAERRQIWQRAFPAGTPREHLEYDRLAKFSLTGGNIHSIALVAAFLAAEAQVPVSMPIILEAVRMELRKLERPVNDAELRSAAAGRAYA